MLRQKTLQKMFNEYKNSIVIYEARHRLIKKFVLENYY